MIVQGTSVGLDVHALSVVAHAVDEETGKIARARLCPDHGEVLGWLHQLRSPVRVTYDAGPTGFGLARAITEAGMQCVVAAPSNWIRALRLTLPSVGVQPVRWDGRIPVDGDRIIVAQWFLDGEVRSSATVQPSLSAPIRQLVEPRL